MRILDLALKDLVQITRDWKAALFLVAMPILFTLFFGLIFDPGGGDEGDPRLVVGLLAEGQGDPLAEPLGRMLAGSSLVRPVQLEGVGPSEAEAQVAAGELAAAVILPDGYGERALAGEDAPLTVIVDESTAAGQSAHTGIESAVSRLRGAVEAARIAAGTYEEQEGFESADARRAYLQASLDRALARWDSPPLRVDVEQATGERDEGAEVASGFVQSSPGMMVQFAVFGLITSAMVLVLERKGGALQRLMTTPIRRGEVIAGHILAMFSVVLVQQLLLVAIGQFFFGVDYARAPLATAAMVLAMSLWAACLGLLIGALAKGEEQVIALSLVTMFLFAGLGGAWFPLEVTGETFAAIGHVLPTAWAMDGLQNIILRGQGLSSILLPAGVLLAYGAAFFALAVWRFRFE
jgi:ABC-2 type transport system permease protein